jgi:hypothetical protein
MVYVFLFNLIVVTSHTDIPFFFFPFKGAPAADFDRMVWGGIMASIFFLADDYVDSGRMMDRIPGFKAAATGTGVSFLASNPCFDTNFFQISLSTQRTELSFAMTWSSVVSRRPVIPELSISLQSALTNGGIPTFTSLLRISISTLLFDELTLRCTSLTVGLFVVFIDLVSFCFSLLPLYP